MRPRPVFVVLIVSFAMAVAACSSSPAATAESESVSSTVTTEPLSATSAASDEGLRGAAGNTIEAWNTSADAFVARFAPSGDYAGVPIDEAKAINSLSFYIGLGDQVEVHVCDSSKRMVECTVTGVDDLGGSQGYTFEGSAWMAMNEDGFILRYQWNSNGDVGGKIGYIEEMVEWVRDEHPDIFEEVFADDTCEPQRLDCWGDWAESADAAAALLDLHPEYLSAGS